MMKQQYTTFIVLSILISFALLSVSIPRCDANYASWGRLNEGAAFHDGAHIRMPFADVRINITRALSTIHVSLDSEFHILTNVTQNTTLAYVYPSFSGAYVVHNSLTSSSDSGLLDMSDNMQIYANGSEVDYIVIDYDNFTESITENYYEGYSFIQYNVMFAIFDIELIANTTLVLSTVSDIILDANFERFDFDYIVGSARTFEGHTMEQIHIKVIEEVPFLTKTFVPDESLSVTELGNTTDAVWDFNVTEFSWDQVSFGAEVVEYETNNWLPEISSVVFVVLIVALVYQFGYKKSKEFNQ